MVPALPVAVVNTYYSAYLRGAHVTALTKLIDAVEGQPFMSNGVKRVLGGIVTRAKAADGSHSLLVQPQAALPPLLPTLRPLHLTD